MDGRHEPAGTGIPPRTPRFFSQATCTAPRDFFVAGHLDHAHELARRVVTEHLLPNGTKLATVGADAFACDAHAWRFVDPPHAVERGDKISTACVFNSTGRDEEVKGGLSHRAEMCIDFLLYYPAFPVEGGASEICVDSVESGVVPADDPPLDDETNFYAKYAEPNRLMTLELDEFITIKHAMASRAKASLVMISKNAEHPRHHGHMEPCRGI